MSIQRLAFTLVLLLAMSNPSDSAAQPPPTVLLPSVPACSPTASVVSVRVHDAAGNPIPGTMVEMTRLRDGKALGTAKEMRAGQGEFALFESDALSWISTQGDRIRLRVRAGKRRATAVIVVGRDASACRISKISGPDVITLK